MPSFERELDLLSQGYYPIAGIDEAGRGPLAGPVVAGAVILDPDQPTLSWLRQVDDSKKLTPKARERAFAEINSRALGVGVGIGSCEEIDRLGISPATRLAMARAVGNLPVKPSHLLVDYVPLTEPGIPFLSLVRGDSICYTIAAASIVAKVTRDRMMVEADAVYPGYGFSQHKGYPTLQHRRLLAELGPCPIHRRSFALQPRLPENVE